MAILDIGPWGWVIGGLVLMGIELLAPGAFMVWLGLAALVTGLLLFLVKLPVEMTLVLFAVLAVIAVLTGRRLIGPPRQRGESALNDRAAKLLGRTFVLEEPISEGRGRVRVDDTLWRVEGPDLPSGAQVRVVGMDGMLLKVERA
ncbi:NfeD family protein [Alsobacter sp. R-9]